MALRNRARSTRLLVVTLVSASLITITVDYRQGDAGPLAAAGDAALEIISPLQEAVSKVTDPVGNFFSTLVHLPAIRHENEQLKERVAQLESERATFGADEDLFAEAQALLGLQETLENPRVDTVPAQVIANSVSNFEWTIQLDVGTSDGIEVNMPVVAAAGLVGHVVRVSSGSAVVQLIIDPESSVAGRLVTAEEDGLIRGEGEDDLQMGLVDPDAVVQPGDAVVTAGYRILEGSAGSLYPPNVLIGSVSRVLSEDNALEKLVTIRPAVDFSTLNLVLVVRPSGSD